VCGRWAWPGPAGELKALGAPPKLLGLMGRDNEGGEGMGKELVEWNGKEVNNYYLPMFPAALLQGSKYCKCQCSWYFCVFIVHL